MLYNKERIINLSIVVAYDNNRAIGRNNHLLWHLPNDLKHFKKITMGKPIVMGRKTFESIGRPLPGRDNLVISSSNHLSMSEKTEINNLWFFASIERLYDFIGHSNYSEIMIIGGGEIYKQFLPKANKIYLTLVDAKFADADVFFPKLDNSWQVLTSAQFFIDDKHQYNYTFMELIRK